MKFPHAAIIMMIATNLLPATSKAQAPQDLAPIFPKEVILREKEATVSGNEGKRVFEVFARLSFSNHCLSPKEKFRSLRIEEDRWDFSLYFLPSDATACTKIYLPVEKDVLVGTVEISHDERVPLVRVNGMAAK